MEQKDTFDFLLRAAIPEVTEKKKLPAELRENKDNINSAKKLVWECILRAHRDVLSGRKYVADYSSKIDENGINKFALKLYTIITEEQTSKLSSNYLIDRMKSEVGYRIGPIQKLVNMTLKYMFLLQLFNKLEGYNIAEGDIDCPLDSIILGKLNKSEIKWTQDFKKDEKTYGCAVYNEIQAEICNIQKSKNKSKISYDFENWQRF